MISLRRTGALITFDFRFLQGMHAEDIARRFAGFASGAASVLSGASASFLGCTGRGGIVDICANCSCISHHAIDLTWCSKLRID